MSDTVLALIACQDHPTSQDALTRLLTYGVDWDQGELF